MPMKLPSSRQLHGKREGPASSPQDPPSPTVQALQLDQKPLLPLRSPPSPPPPHTLSLPHTHTHRPCTQVKRLSGDKAEEVAKQLYLRNVSSTHAMLGEAEGEDGALGPLPEPLRSEGEMVSFNR